jgi:aryl-alcohol dehydrogenase-like predicted oxidoreductase
MRYRTFARTGWQVSEIGFGAWAIGSAWGPVDDADSMAALHRAVDLGVNFIDTADVYGDGRSERLVAQLRKQRSETIYVATKVGRRLDPHTAEGYNSENLNRFVERSLRNLETDCIDLLQLHCPPSKVYYFPEVFEALDAMVSAGKIRFYGVSVETVEEALKAIEYPNVQSVQIIFNLFRHRPSDLLFHQVCRKRVAILARVPLASGLLTGRITRDTVFANDDHRHFNRHGEAFDAGETFSGVDFDTALQAVEELRLALPQGVTLAQFALRWILLFDAVSCVIPGAKRPAQVDENIQACALPGLTRAQFEKVQDVYDRYIRPLVHQRW